MRTLSLKSMCDNITNFLSCVCVLRRFLFVFVCLLNMSVYQCAMCVCIRVRCVEVCVCLSVNIMLCISNKVIRLTVDKPGMHQCVCSYQQAQMLCGI